MRNVEGIDVGFAFCCRVDRMEIEVDLDACWRYRRVRNDYDMTSKFECSRGRLRSQVHFCR